MAETNTTTLVADPNNHSSAPAPAAEQTAKPLRIAQDVSEKEAFDLAKELGTADGWRAFLVKFPTGFRAEIARSYLKKIESSGQPGTAAPGVARPQTTPGAGSQPAGGGQAAHVDAASLFGSYRITAQGNERAYINNNDTGVVGVGPNKSDRRSGHWIFESVPDSKYVRIRNRWKGTHLSVEEGVVLAEKKGRSDPVSHWTLETASGTAGHVIIRNRATGRYLSPQISGRFLFAALGDPAPPRGHWRLVEVDDSTQTTTSPPVAPRTTRAPSLRCSGGYIRKGSCRCGKGKKRVKVSTNNYRCRTVRVTKPSKPAKPAAKSCYTAGCSSFCGPGYVMIKGKCLHITDYEKRLEAQEG